jgi:hypothetical protein
VYIQLQSQGCENAHEDIQSHGRLAVLDAMDRPHADVRDHRQGSLIHSLTATLVAHALPDSL